MMLEWDTEPLYHAFGVIILWLDVSTSTYEEFAIVHAAALQLRDGWPASQGEKPRVRRF